MRAKRGKKGVEDKRIVIDWSRCLYPSGNLLPQLRRTGLETVRLLKWRPCLRITKGTSTLLKKEQRQRVDCEIND